MFAIQRKRVQPLRNLPVGLIRLSAGIPSPSCNLRIMVSVSGRFRIPLHFIRAVPAESIGSIQPLLHEPRFAQRRV